MRVLSQFILILARIANAQDHFNAHPESVNKVAAVQRKVDETKVRALVVCGSCRPRPRVLQSAPALRSSARVRGVSTHTHTPTYAHTTHTVANG